MRQRKIGFGVIRRSFRDEENNRSRRIAAANINAIFAPAQEGGTSLNLEEPALFNDMVERFVALVEAGRWPVRDIRSMMAQMSFRARVFDAPRNDSSAYFAFSARLSRNTPCSPNMFQNHQGKFTRSGRP